MTEGSLTFVDSAVGLTTTASMSVVGLQVLGEFAEDGANLLRAGRSAAAARAFHGMLAKGSPLFSRLSTVGSLWTGGRAVGRVFSEDRPVEWQDLSIILSSSLTSLALYYGRRTIGPNPSSRDLRSRFFFAGAGLLLDFVDLGYSMMTGKSWGEIGVQAGTLIVFNADRNSRSAFKGLFHSQMANPLNSGQTRPPLSEVPTLEQLAAWSIVHGAAQHRDERSSVYSGGGYLAAPRRRKDPHDSPDPSAPPRNEIDPWHDGVSIHREVTGRLDQIGVVEVDRLISTIHDWEREGQSSFWLRQALKEIAASHPVAAVKAYAGLMSGRIETTQVQKRQDQGFMEELERNLRYDLRVVMERIHDSLNANNPDFAEDCVRFLILNGNEPIHQALLREERPAVRALVYRVYRKANRPDKVRDLWVSRERGLVAKSLDEGDFMEREEALWVAAEAAVAGAEDARKLLIRYAYGIDSELQMKAEELLDVVGRMTIDRAAN